MGLFFALRYAHRFGARRQAQCGAALDLLSGILQGCIQSAVDAGARFKYQITMSDREEFLTAKQLAEILQVSETTVRRMAQKRRIPSVRLTPRIIRFHLDAVREALDVPRASHSHGVQTDDAQLSFEDLLS
jgi:excisionase family DNA binding protein